MKAGETLVALLAIVTLSLIVAPALAQDEAPMMVKSQSGVPLDEHVDPAMCNPDGVAIGGYDVVSYRQDGGPVHGDAEITAEHDGGTWRFASNANRDTFLEDPARFVPAYSGFCAVTLALGRVTCPEYTNFKIENDQLLLFEVTGFTNGRTLWNSDVDGFRRQADDNFTKLVDVP